MSDLESLSGKQVHEMWRSYLKENGWDVKQGFKTAAAYHDLPDDMKAAWDSLALQLGARHLIDREFIRKMVRTAVLNHVTNTLQLSRGEVQAMIKRSIRDHFFDWFRDKVDKYWVKATITEVLKAEIKSMIKDKWTVNVSTNVNVEEKKG